MDSVRARNTSLHGHPNETTPFLEEFGERATVYEQARAPSSWSLPSHVSILTGDHVGSHGLVDTGQRLTSGHTFYERLSDRGYDTAVFSENPLLTRVDVGLKDAFDTVYGPQNLVFPDAANPTEFVLTEGRGQYVDYLRHCLSHDHPLKSVVNGVATKAAWSPLGAFSDRLRTNTSASVYVDQFLDWTADRNGPWAACINFMDAHLPYEPRPEHDRWGGKALRKIQSAVDDQVWSFHAGDRPWWQLRALEALYDGTINQIDAQVARLVHELESRGRLDDTLLVVTADHGEGFGEPSELRPVRTVGHGIGVDEVLLHVPTVIKYPGQHEGRRVREVASLVELPRVVESTVDGGRPSLVADGPVLASADDMMSSTKENARTYVDDLTPYTGNAVVTYRDEGETVRKESAWGETAGRFTVVDAQTAYRRAAADPAAVTALYDALPDRQVTETGQEVGDADRATQQRLEDLGYM